MSLIELDYIKENLGYNEPIDYVYRVLATNDNRGLTPMVIASDIMTMIAYFPTNRVIDLFCTQTLHLSFMRANNLLYKLIKKGMIKMA